MNKKVQDLGLKNTYFKNSTGLDEDGHYSSAYDMAIIARELIKHDEIFDYSKVYEDYLREDTANKFWLVNTNKLVRFYQGADGLKTGHTDNAKYCIAATEKRNGMRLIAIVLGEEESKVRNIETMALLDYGFNTKKVDIIKKKDSVITKVKVSKGTKEILNLTTSKDLAILKNKNDNTNKYTLDTKINKITLPIKKDQILGKVYVKDKNKILVSKDLIAKDNINSLSFMRMFLGSIKDIIVGSI